MYNGVMASCQKGHSPSKLATHCRRQTIENIITATEWCIKEWCCARSHVSLCRRHHFKDGRHQKDVYVLCYACDFYSRANVHIKAFSWHYCGRRGRRDVLAVCRSLFDHYHLIVGVNIYTRLSLRP